MSLRNLYAETLKTDPEAKFHSQNEFPFISEQNLTVGSCHVGCVGCGGRILRLSCRYGNVSPLNVSMGTPKTRNIFLA